jgi:hypothetical protein
MASATETAILALKAALDGLAGATLPKDVLRNEDLASRLVEMQDAVAAYANLWDGKQLGRDECLGADSGSLPNGYDITHEARLELAFVGGDGDVREALYDAALVAVNDKLAADRTLAGAVDWVAFGEPEFQGSGLVTDGIANAKGVILPIVLTFRSSRPF